MKRNTETILARIVDRLVGPRGEAVVDALAQTEQFRHVLQQIDDAEVEKRSALVKRLASLPATHEARCIEANAARDRAIERRQAAERALREALDKEREAYSLSSGLSYAYERDRGEIERALLDSSDPRIGTFLQDLQRLGETVRHAGPDMIQVPRWNGRMVMVTDNTRANAAWNAIGNAAVRAREMRMLPLTRAEVTQQLRALAQTLKGPFERFTGKQLMVPAIEGDESDPAATIH